MSPPQNGPAANYSSSTAAEKAISTLRARLRSEDLPTVQPASRQTNNVYEKLQTRFSSIFQGQNDANNTKLAETFALYGQQVYGNSLKSIQSVYETTASNIALFHAQAASTSSNATALYDNISYPLSATICHSKNSHRASIGRHIRALYKKISSAESELSRLNEEWRKCVDEEARLLAEGVAEDGGEGQTIMEDLLGRIDEIVRRQGDEIDDLDQEYRNLLWTESNRMMHAMMAD